jgi:DNA helicase II / ATP-dependent DNA helicase PcrA
MDSSLVVIAPAGCGKTEALALRAAGLLERGVITPPRRILLVTFTNRSRENIAERLQAHIAKSSMDVSTTIQNLHGLAARIVRAHGNIVGIDPAWEPPRSDWVTEQCKARSLSGAQTSIVLNNLQTAKLVTRTDAEVLQFLEAVGHSATLEIERQRLEERRLTYDDLPRLADLILRNDAVADLYQNHFGYVIVDEFQDLTAQQLSIVDRISNGRVTFAGDPAQGIYTFTGADPNLVIDRAVSRDDRVITFAESHRSSPAVLALVNALAPATKGAVLECSRPSSWPSGGLAAHIDHEDRGTEAAWVISTASRILTRAPHHRVGVLTRTKWRRDELDAALSAGVSFEWHRWDDPIFDSHTAPLVRTALRRTNDHDLREAPNVREYLLSLVNGHELQDPATRESLIGAADWVEDLVQAGESIRAINDRVRAGDGDTLLTAPGLHLLTGHAGKGQQFDWVIVLGLEQGSIPFYRATTPEGVAEEARVLAVMLSRARHGVFTSRSLSEVKPWGTAVVTAPSEFTSLLASEPGYLPWSDARSWLNTVDWEALAIR